MAPKKKTPFTYKPTEGSPFYRQLLLVLSALNKERSSRGEPSISFRQALHSMGLGDPFTGKVKSGTYIPTTERLERLADFLNVNPATFDAYVVRYADASIRDGRLLEMFRVLASLDERSASRIESKIENYALSLVQDKGRKREGKEVA